MRFAQSLALFMTYVLLGTVLRLGSASLRLRPPGSASVCILVLRRCRRRLLLGRRLWLAAPSRFLVSSLRVRALTLWQMTLSLPLLNQLILLLRSWRGPGLWGPGIGVPSPFRRWKGWSSYSRISWR